MSHAAEPPALQPAIPSLPRPLLLEVYAHARATYPEECCGFLIGPRDQDSVDEVRRCVNAQNRLHAQDPTRFPRTAREAYYLGVKDTLFLDASLQDQRPVKIIYHSHPDVGAYFSAEDTRAALGREPDETAAPQYAVDHLVIDAQAEHIAGAKLFRWAPSQRRFVLAAEYGGEHQP